MKNGSSGLPKDRLHKDKILLALLPFWTPQIPPLGISCLKSFLQSHGYEVRIVDANVEEGYRKIYNKYFDILREYVSKEKRGNFYNIGHEVLQNHLMAHLNYENEGQYIKLIKILVDRTFYFAVNDQQVQRLNVVVEEFYTWLEQYVLDLLEKENPSVLGLSVYKGTLPASMFTFKITREKYPHIKTVMGGAVFAQTLGMGTDNFNYFLEKSKDYLDKIIIGEGETLFLRLLRDELPESQRVFTLADLESGTMDLDSAPMPDFSDLNLPFYPNMAAYTSRSCPYQCTFCTETVYWGKYRKKTAKKITAELVALSEKYQSQLFLLCDSLLNPVVNEISREFINIDRSIYWDGYLRVDKYTCDPEKTLLWRRGGFYRARLGVESGSQRILDMMDKKVTIDQVKTAVANLANVGIKTTTYWIVGYPGETEEDFQQTLDMIEELKDEIYEAECNPFGFYLTGQVNSGEWTSKNKCVPLYPENTRDILIVQSWFMDCEPSREETYRRISRFVEHCNRLEIANPYSLYDISQADERWKNLHKSAVPPLVQFKNKDSYVNENKYVKKVYQAQSTLEEEIKFGF